MVVLASLPTAEQWSGMMFEHVSWRGEAMGNAGRHGGCFDSGRFQRDF